MASLKHLLGIEGLNPVAVTNLLDLAESYVLLNRSGKTQRDLLRGRTLINLFFEDSTRTRTSFELAGRRLGADVVNMSVATSSVTKGETLLDTAATLNAMNCDLLVVRHNRSGAPHLLAEPDFYDLTMDYLRKAHCVVTGTPVRRGLGRINRAVAAEKFGLNPTLPIVLVMGGSQGAHGINQLIHKTTAMWHADREEVQFIHLTGQADANIAEINYRRQRLTAVVRAFSTEMEHFYSLADVVISRSGAASLTELSHYGLPSVLVPYPAAADDHQTFNARIFEQAGAAKILVESKTTPEELHRVVAEILENKTLRERMAEAARSLAGPRVPR